MTPAWLEAGWEPSPAWCDADRIELASALLELVERDIYRCVYGKPGRPNFASVQAVLHALPAELETARGSAVAMLHAARTERRGS